MKCLAVYDWEAGFGMGSVYQVLSEHLSKITFEAKNLKVVFQDWPRAKKISHNDLATLFGQVDQVKSIEGELEFPLNGNHIRGSFLISSMPKMFFVALPKGVEKVASFEAFAKRLAEKVKLGYGYVFHSEDGDEPALYASGVTYVKAGESADPKSSETDERWFNELVLGKDGRKRYRDDGMMRNVYYLNILNVHHLERKINGESFLSLIPKMSWGNIKKIGTDNWLWRVGGESRAEAQNYLRSSSVLI